AAKLQLSPEKQAEIAKILQERAKALAGASGAAQKQQAGDFERRLREQLTGDQLTQWEQLSSPTAEAPATEEGAAKETATAKTEEPAAPKPAGPAPGQVPGQGRERFTQGRGFGGGQGRGGFGGGPGGGQRGAGAAQTAVGNGKAGGVEQTQG